MHTVLVALALVLSPATADRAHYDLSCNSQEFGKREVLIVPNFGVSAEAVRTVANALPGNCSEPRSHRDDEHVEIAKSGKNWSADYVDGFGYIYTR